MMARICDECSEQIEQREFIELTVRVLDPEEGIDQDDAAQAYGDFCDSCIATGKAVANLLKRVEWTLEPKQREPAHPNGTSGGALAGDGSTTT